jgi:hypothetical protein
MAYGKTKEEQETIARQSQLKLVLDWAETRNFKLDLKELMAITNVFADYVVEGYSKTLSDRLEKIQDHLENKGIDKALNK